MKNILILIFLATGIFLSILLIVKLGGNNKKNVDNKTPKIENTAPSNSFTVYKKSGKEIATTTKPVKAYLDPLKAYERVIGEGDALVVLENNPNQSFLFTEETKAGMGIEKWWAMPAGNYLVYPKNKKEIIFYWSEEKPNF